MAGWGRELQPLGEGTAPVFLSKADMGVDKTSRTRYLLSINSTEDSLLMAMKTTEQRIASIEEKIAKKRKELEALEAQKQKLLHPVTMRGVMAKAKEVGLSPEEIAEKLGLEM